MGKKLLKSNQSIHLIALLIIIIWGIILYSNSLNVPYQFDSLSFVESNPFIKNIRNLSAIINYAPQRWVTYLTFAINYSINVKNVFSFHLFNLIIHLSNAILIYFLMNILLNLVRVKSEKIEQSKKIIPFLVSLLFVVHPLHIESITYIYQRFTPLVTFFYLASLIFYIRFRRLSFTLNDDPTIDKIDDKPDKTTKKKSKKKKGKKKSSKPPVKKPEKSTKTPHHQTKGYIYYLLCLTSLVLGMYSKEIMFSAPIMIILIEIYFFDGFKNGFIKRWKSFIPILLTFLVIPLTYIFWVKGMGFSNIDLNNISRDTYGYSRFIYLSTQFNVLMRYLRLFFIPTGLNLDYDFPISKTPFEYPTFLHLLILIGLFIIGIRLYKKHRLISFGIIWFFITISITSSIIPIKDVIFEHRTYLPSIGFFITTILLIYLICPTRLTNKIPLLIIIVCLIFSVLTYKRNELWRDPIKLWSDVVKKSPNKYRPYVNLGNAYNRQEKYEKAIENYLIAIKLSPKIINTYNNLAAAYLKQEKYEKAVNYYEQVLKLNTNNSPAHNNLGLVMVKQKKYEEAIKHYSEALRIDPYNAQAYTNMGNALTLSGKLEEALPYYHKALEIRPDFISPRYNLSKVLIRLRKTDEALDQLHKLIAISPNYAEAYNDIGNILIKQQKINEGLEYYRKALKINPNNAETHYNLGFFLSQLGKTDEAIKQFSEVLRIEPNSVKTHQNLGLILTRKGKIEEANSHFSKIIKIDPEYISAYINLSNNLTKLGKSDEAVTQLSEALKIKPNNPSIHRRLGDIMTQQGKFKEAIQYYREAYRLNPESYNIANKLAWTLATSPAPELRNAEEAVKLAEFACEKTKHNNPIILDTLAAAYAEAGRFQDAIKTSQKALALAQSKKQQDLANDINNRIDLYKAHKPFYENEKMKPLQ